MTKKQLKSKKKYIYNSLRKIGISDDIINDLYQEKITKEEVDIIINSNYPYDICRLFITKKFRELQTNRNTIISDISNSSAINRYCTNAKHIYLSSNIYTSKIEESILETLSDYIR